MLTHLLPIRSLLLGTALLLIGNGLLSTLIALRGSLEGFSDQLIGLMGSAYFVGFLLGTFTIPSLIRNIGHIRAFTFLAAAMAATVLLHSLIVHPWVWLALRVLTGMALVGIYTIIESWLNSRTEPASRGFVLGVYTVANMCAMALAQQFLHLASPAEFVLFSLAAVMVCFSVLPLASTRQPQPVVHAVPKLSLKALWKAAPVAANASILSGLVQGSFWSIMPLYATRMGFDAGGVAMLMTATILGGAVLQLPLGRLSDKVDRRLVLGLSTALATLAAIGIAFLGEIQYALLGGAFMFGGMMFALYPIAIAHLVDHLSSEDFLSGNVGMLLLHGLGAIAGPVITGLLMSQIGPLGLPVYFAAILAPFTVYVLLRVRRARDHIVEEPAQFVPMERTSTEAMEMAAAAEEHHVESVTESAEALPPQTDDANTAYVHATADALQQAGENISAESEVGTDDTPPATPTYPPEPTRRE